MFINAASFLCLFLSNFPVECNESIGYQKASSSISCSDPHIQGKHHDRQCTYYNFCFSECFGIFPMYPVATETDFDSISAQLATYINEGGQVYLTPRLDVLNTTDGTNSRKLDIIHRKTALIYAPTAWPDKWPFHATVNHFIPLFQALENAEPMRVFKYPTRGRVWRYDVDLMAVSAGMYHTIPAISKNTKERISGLFGVNQIFDIDYPHFRNCPAIATGAIASDAIEAESTTGGGGGDDFLSPSHTDDTLYCYERLHAGVGGTRGHYSHHYTQPVANELINPTLVSDLRQVILQYRDGCPSSMFPYHQTSLSSRPVVVLVQRVESGDISVRAHGDRTFHNIDTIEQLLRSMDQEQQRITFYGQQAVVLDEQTMTLQMQVCLAAKASILIGFHGNALGLSMYMPARESVMIEYCPLDHFNYSTVARVAQVHHIIEPCHTPSRNLLDVAAFERSVDRAIKLWQRSVL